jgi:poly(3-hydroxybutyrate) depolymerase
VAWAAGQGFSASELEAGPFTLLALTRQRSPVHPTLSVYIEGDGAPWVTPWQAPNDPTPLKPTALAMAAADPAAIVVYLGRPCQYQSAENLAKCDPRWWSDRRFAPEVLAAFDDALTQLKTRLGARQLRLVGYSGGGVIAALLAARRPDVVALVTVASPLALTDWVAWHALTPFTNASDPSLAPGPLPPAIHWAGDKDRVVPPHIIDAFVLKKGGQRVIRAGYDHECCWARDWATLIVQENPP